MELSEARIASIQKGIAQSRAGQVRTLDEVLAEFASEAGQPLTHPIVDDTEALRRRAASGWYIDERQPWIRERVNLVVMEALNLLDGQGLQCDEVVTGVAMHLLSDVENNRADYDAEEDRPRGATR